MSEILARPISRVPTLRGKTIINIFFEGEHAHPGLVRAGRQVSERRRYKRRGVRQQRGKGRIACRHAADHSGAGRRHGRHAAQQVRRSLSCRRRTRMLGHKRRRRLARASESGAARPVYRPAKARRSGGQEAGYRRRHPPQPRRAIEHLGIYAHGERASSCAVPATLLPPGFEDMCDANGLLSIELDADKAIDGADIVMALRIQKERMEGRLAARPPGILQPLRSQPKAPRKRQSRGPRNASGAHESRRRNIAGSGLRP